MHLTCRFSPLLSTLSKGVWFILALGIISCESSFVPNHPYALNEQSLPNSTALDHLETFSEEETDTATKQSQLEVSTEFVTEDVDAHGFTVTDSDLPNTTHLLLLNSSIEESNVTEYNVTDNSSSEGFKMVAVSSSAFNTGIIVGVSLLVVIVAVLIGAISFILYRHNMWNRPQTLSDKCSNDESTGYIDDTFRENSEEMYSLDNDSFLNSLEAMTIQNYWTDHVKHTKL